MSDAGDPSGPRPRTTRPETVLGNQRGSVLVWLALLIVVMLGFVGLGVDIGKAVATKTQLQNAADAAALAAASAIDSTSGTIVVGEAVSRAQVMAANNQAFEDGPTAVLVDASDVVVFTGANGKQQVTVTTRRDGAHPMFTNFAKVIGLPQFALRASATAQVERANGVCDVLPMGAQAPQGGFTPGCGNVYQLKAPGGGGTNGNYGFVDFPACNLGACGGMNPNGANTLRCIITNGYKCCIETGDQISSEPGNKSGPFLQAMQARFNMDTDQDQGICYKDYTGNLARVVTVPIVTPFGNGSSPVTVLGFAGFFLRDMPGTGSASTINGEFLYLTTPGIGGGTGTGPGAFTVSLVQ
jgi:Flp pilus assembly protein TadG